MNPESREDFAESGAPAAPQVQENGGLDGT